MQHLPLLILALLLACAPPVLSRHPAPATETLDVAASLSRVHAAVSTDALPLHHSLTATDVVHHTDTTTTTGRLTLRLHSRDFLPSQQVRHPTYKSLVLARLRRDSAWAAADGLKSADLLPSNTEPLFAASAADIQGPVVSGVGQGSGEYFSRVGVSRPARKLYMVLDTGSDITWCWTLAIPPTAFAMDDAGSGGIIVDSGAAVTRLQSAAYSALRDAFVQGTQSLPRTSGVSLFDTCYDLSGQTSMQVPAVSLRFEGGGELKLPAKNYLIPVDGSGTYCLAFAATSGAVSIIGNVQQQGVRVSFDTANLTAVDALRQDNATSDLTVGPTYQKPIKPSKSCYQCSLSSTCP